MNSIYVGRNLSEQPKVNVFENRNLIEIMMFIDKISPLADNTQ